MEAVAEHLVSIYLTRGGQVFIVPQYSIPLPGGVGERACPDFVALDFGMCEIIVVEVSTASNLASLIDRVRERDIRWFQPIYTKLKADGVVPESWKIRFLGFIRKDNLQGARDKFSGVSDVAFAAIEDATFSWKYWDQRKGGGLPR